MPKKEGKQTRGRGRGRGRDRGRGRGQNEIVQSKSIFSEGPGAKKNLGKQTEDKSLFEVG